MWLQKSSFRATTISAAADGVGARTSAAKSAIVKSTSWPTAEMMGTGEAGDGSRDRFVVERPQIFDRPAPAPDDHDIDAGHPNDVPDAAGNVGRGALALHTRRANDEMGIRVAAAEYLDDVANRRAVERRDDADFAGQRRQRAFTRRIEESFGLQPSLQLIERELERAEPMRLHALAHDLIFTFRLVHAETPADDYMQAIFGLELQRADIRLEHDRFDLGSGIFQREIEMPGVPETAVGNFCLDPDLGVRVFQNGRGCWRSGR